MVKDKFHQDYKIKASNKLEINMYVKLNFLISFLFFVLPVVAMAPCRVKSLAGTQPEQICKMRDFMKEYEKQTKSCFGKNAILIHGPLGTGKSLAAKAIGEESGVYVIYYDLKEKFKDGAWTGLKIKEIYQEAEEAVSKLKKPVVVIIDEIDQISEKNMNQLSLREKVALEELCNQIKLHEHCAYIMTILATAKVEVVNKKLEAACVLVKMDIPSRQNRLEIIKFYAKKQKVNLPESLYEELAKNYSDFSGRLIEDAFKTAHVLAVARNINDINEATLREAFARKRDLNDVKTSSLYIMWRSICETLGIV